MNLIEDKWIPVKRNDGSLCQIAPWEIGTGENPVTEIKAPRPDFRGALYQFLIGLVQTAFAPQDEEEWEDYWDNPPSCKTLKEAFEKFKDGFELFNQNGPAFMQDYDLPEKAVESEIRSLLIDAPGDNTIKENKDHFIKQHSIKFLCDACTATALFTLQINAPSGGQGHRTGLRGGGPLTTIVFPNSDNQLIWEIIWLNILTCEEYFSEPPQKTTSDVFPWMGPTRISKEDKETLPEDVNELQLYWGMPRRIRLSAFKDKGICDICNTNGRVWTSYHTINYGTKYSSTWLHTLSPYRFKKEKDGKILNLALKGKKGGFSYPDWLSLTLVHNPEQEQTAKVVRSYHENKIGQLREKRNLIWCSGYDMDNMKARCWYDQTMPILIIPAEKQNLFLLQIQKILDAANDTARLLRNQIMAAWFKRPKDAKGDTSHILSSFWEETEEEFFNTADKIQKNIINGISTIPVLLEWRKSIIKVAEMLFDRFAVQDTDDIKCMKRVALAAHALTNILNSKKTKSLQALKEEE